MPRPALRESVVDRGTLFLLVPMAMSCVTRSPTIRSSSRRSSSRLITLHVMSLMSGSNAPALTPSSSAQRCAAEYNGVPRARPLLSTRGRGGQKPLALVAVLAGRSSCPRSCRGSPARDDLAAGCSTVSTVCSTFFSPGSDCRPVVAPKELGDPALVIRACGALDSRVLVYVAALQDVPRHL